MFYRDFIEFVKESRQVKTGLQLIFQMGGSLYPSVIMMPLLESLNTREHRGLGRRLCLGKRDPASESASAARMRSRGPRTRADGGGSRGSVPRPGGR